MNNTKANGPQNAYFSKISVPGLIRAFKIWDTDFPAQKALQSQTTAKKALKNNENISLQTMNNTKANGLQNAHFSRISVPGLICPIKIRETDLCSLEGPLESNYSKETVKEK